MPQLEIDIIGRFAKFQDALDKVGRDTERTSKRLEGAFKSFTNILKLGFVAHEVKDFLHGVAEATIAFEKSQALLANTLEQTGYSAGVTKEHLDALAESLQKGTGFNEDDIRQAEVALLRFGNIAGKTFDDALKLSTNLAASMGIGVADAATLVARALEDPIAGFKGLRGVVKPLTETEKEAVAAFKAAGDEAASMNIVLAHMSNVSGAAEAANQGLTGATTGLHNAVDDFQKALGSFPLLRDPVVGAINLIAGAFNFLADSIKAATKYFGDIDRLLDKVAGIKPKTPGQGGEAEADAGREAERARALAEAADAAQAQARKRNAALNKVAREADVADARHNAEIGNDALENAYARGEILTHDFYAQKLAIAKNSNAQEVAGFAGAINAQEALLVHSKAAQKSINNELARLQSERQAAQEKGDKVHVSQLDQTIGALKRQSAATPDQEDAVRAEIERLKRDRDRKISEGLDLERKSEQSVVIEAQRLLDVQDEIHASLLEQNGELVKADRLRAGIRDRARTDDVNKTKSPEALRELARLEKQEDAARQLKARLTEAGQVQETLANKERDIASQVQSAQIDEFDALSQTNRARRDAVILLNQLADAAEKHAKSSGDPRDAISAQTLRSNADALAASNSEAANAATALNLSQRETNILLGDEQILEQKIANQRANGAITTQEALHLSDAARTELIGKLERQLELEQALAAKEGDTIGGREAQLQVRALGAQIETLAASSHQVRDELRGVFQDALVDPLIDVFNKTKSADEAMKSFFKNIAQSLLRLAAQNIAESIFGNLLGGGKTGGSGTGLFGIFANLLGGGASGGVGASEGVSIVGSANGNIMTSSGPLQLERYARGGIARRPQVSLFGEGRMPEAYIPLPDGRSVPVTMSSTSAGARATIGPSAIVPQQQWKAPAITLQLHPNAMQMTLSDWFQGELARTLATR